jgi:hypothetical protein
MPYASDYGFSIEGQLPSQNVARPFTDQKSTNLWPQWHHIEDSLIELGLAERGSRLKPEGFGPTPVLAKGFGFGLFTCEPSQPVQKGRASPHRLKVLCTCGAYIFFGKLGQHYRAAGHR